jgi:hypothetical protein
MLVLLEVGRRIGLRHIGEASGTGAVDGAVFALLGLMIAFAFSGAALRFDTRRQLIVDEANAIGTAYLRLDLLPSAVQGPLREKMRHYLEARLAVYRAFPDIDKVRAELARANSMQGEIWSDAVVACNQMPTSQAAMLLLPALNDMIDITTTRSVAAQTHPPNLIYATLGVLALAASMLAGYGMAGSKRRSWLHMFGFALTLAITVYIILDLDYPRFGLITLDAYDQVLVDLLNNMK